MKDMVYCYRKQGAGWFQTEKEKLHCTSLHCNVTLYTVLACTVMYHAEKCMRRLEPGQENNAIPWCGDVMCPLSLALSLHCLAMSCLCIMLSCLVFSCLALSCLALSRLVSSCLALSCLILSCPGLKLPQELGLFRQKKDRCSCW